MSTREHGCYSTSVRVGRVKAHYLECSFHFINFGHAEETRRGCVRAQSRTYCAEKIRKKLKSDGSFLELQ